MMRNLHPIASSAWRAAIVLLSAQVAAVSAMRYFAGTLPPPPPVVANTFADPFLVVHVAGSMIALLAAPLQFVRAIRARWPVVHRVTGRLYVAGCAVGAPTGFVLAVGTSSGPVAATGFAILAVFWGAFTWLGWRAAVERRFGDHRVWMLRSYACAATAITLRLMLPAAAALGFTFGEAYPVIAWASWIVNLALAEVVIRGRRVSTDSYRGLATA